MLFKKIVDNRVDDSFATALRRKRFVFFLKLLEDVPRPLTILDVGGTQDFWERMAFSEEPGVKITVLNIEPQTVTIDNFTSIAGDATDLSLFTDNSFDVVFSNSVIEHVGDTTQQQRMAREVGRVGKRYFIQTPNYYFPLEPHYHFLGFQWLPLEWRAWLLHRFDLGWAKRAPSLEKARQSVDSIRLLRKHELLSLFPGASLYEEKFFGLTKSFIVYVW